MNIPFILDVSLGLIFTYLILSLLASEIQELVATVFQWRAEHLRKSIEIFLSGGDPSDSDNTKVVELANQIYSNPLIKSINQQAKGVLSNIPRQLTWRASAIYRSLKTSPTNQSQGIISDTVFGDEKHSAPSYIPANLFATTLMDTLQFPKLAQTLSESRIDIFKKQRLNDVENIILQLQSQLGENEEFADFYNFIYQGFAELQADFEQTIWNFQQKKDDLNTSVSRMGLSLDKYIESFQANMPNSELTNKAVDRLKFIKSNNLSDVEKTISISGFRPNIHEIAKVLDHGSDIYHEIVNLLKDKDSAAYENLQKILDKMPKNLAANITSLAQQAELKIQTTEEGVNLLRQGIEGAFDSSMERASGVYRRNAKGVALLIGFIIAAATNADAFHMINRLSKDSALRDTIIQNAGQIIIQNRNTLGYVDIETLRTQTDDALTDVALPIGWTDSNLERQINWTSNKPKSFPIIRIFTLIPGWIISGIAIGMGAPFWFDLLGKIVNVRNTGKVPDK
jgi:hypothetical protein